VSRAFSIVRSSEPDERYGEQCRSRLHDVKTYALSEYGIPEELMETILAALVLGYPEAPVWLAIDAKRHPFWDDLGWVLERLGWPKLEDLAPMRSRKPLALDLYEQSTYLWLKERHLKGRIFIDIDMNDRKMDEPTTETYRMICQETVRLNGEVEVERLPSREAREELLRQMKLVLDPVNRQPAVPIAPWPPAVTVWLKDLEDLNRDLQYGPVLLRNIHRLEANRAALFGRAAIASTDQAMVRRILSSYVLRWHRQILRYYWDEVMPLGEPKRIRHRKGGARLETLPDRAKLVRLIDSPWRDRTSFITSLIEHQFLEPISCLRYREYGSPSGYRMKIVVGWCRAARKYYDYTRYGERLIRLLYDPDYDFLNIPQDQY